MTLLLRSAISNSSIPTYQRAWAVYKQFLVQQFGNSDFSLPLKSECVTLFVAYLAKHPYSTSTAFTYISAIGYAHRLAGLVDPTQCSYVKLALKGFAKLNPSVDKRLPITLPILEQIIQSFIHTISGNYRRKLMGAMCSTAFFAALRVGEMTLSSKENTRNIIQIDQIAFMKSSEGETVSLRLTLRFYKHSDAAHPAQVLLKKSLPICPVTLMAEYLSVRQAKQGPLFSWPDGSPILRSQFIDELNRSLAFCGLDSARYKSHSFRIGAASWAAAQGQSDLQIKRFGRWKSNAFLKYIRTPSI